MALKWPVQTVKLTKTKNERNSEVRTRLTRPWSHVRDTIRHFSPVIAAFIVFNLLAYCVQGKNLGNLFNFS